jgi:hypothetical protein
MDRNEYEFHQEAVNEDVRLWVFVSRVGGGVSGKKYTGNWTYRIDRASVSGTKAGRTKLTEGRTRSLTPMTHEQIAGRLWDNLDSLLGND